MKQYSHTQIGYTILAFLGVAILFIETTMTNENASLALVILVIISVLFCTLTINIREGTIHWYFGPGFLKKKIQLSEVERTEIVHNSWWYGWGIRRIKVGWLFNVSGLKAVQLELKNGKTIRLGTDEPAKLKEILDAAIRYT